MDEAAQAPQIERDRHIIVFHGGTRAVYDCEAATYRQMLDDRASGQAAGVYDVWHVDGSPRKLMFRFADVETID